MTDLLKLRSRIADRSKANREVATANGRDRSFHLQYENIYQVIVSLNDDEQNIDTDYMLDGPSGRVVFLAPPTENDLVAIDYLYSAFTDDELQDNIDEYGLDGATIAALEELAADTARFNDYTQGETNNRRSQIFDHVKDLLKYWQGKASDNQAEADGGADGMSFITRNAGSHYDRDDRRPPGLDGSRADG